MGEPAADGQQRTTRVLVIDDDVRIRGLVREILVRARHTVVEAADGREGLRLFEQHQPEVVITDIFMPDRDGLAVILELTGRQGVRVIAISGGGETYPLEFLEDARAFGAWRSLHKPFRADELLGAVTDAVRELTTEETGRPPAVRS